MSSNVLYGVDKDGKKCQIKCSSSGELLVDNKYNRIGSLGNIYSGNLDCSSFTPPLNINNEYKNCILSYMDQAQTGSKPITVWGSTEEESGPVYMYIGSIEVSQVRPSFRMGSLNINVSGFKYIKLFNEETVTLPRVIASLVSA